MSDERERIEHLEIKSEAFAARLRDIEATQSKQGALLMRMQLEAVEAREAIEKKLDRIFAMLTGGGTP